jgi:hypothetical protein
LTGPIESIGGFRATGLAAAVMLADFRGFTTLSIGHLGAAIFRKPFFAAVK